MSPPSYNPLSPEEEAIIVHKGTEPPFTGEYTDVTAEGAYACRRCRALLYWSKDKFPSHCGWPSFDDEIPGSVTRTPDVDGRRTEITCAHCSGHLGHVFVGEHMTQKNTRHCVNSLSLRFVPKDHIKLEHAIFAGGCFWGVEYYMKQHPGVIQTTVGYVGGEKEHPTYEQVCRKDTGHLEAIEVVYDPERTTYEALAKLFFEIHDPTDAGGQGPDRGSQYQSAIFYLNDEQKRIAENCIEELKTKGYAAVTKILPAKTFWKAEDSHQNYYAKTGGSPYCHRYTKRFDP